MPSIKASDFLTLELDAAYAIKVGDTMTLELTDVYQGRYRVTNVVQVGAMNYVSVQRIGPRLPRDT